MNKCNCGYCQEGMSATGGECADRMAAVSKSLKESLKDFNQKKDKK